MRRPGASTVRGVTRAGTAVLTAVLASTACDQDIAVFGRQRIGGHARISTRDGAPAAGRVRPDTLRPPRARSGPGPNGEVGSAAGTPNLASAFARVLDTVRAGTRVPVRVPRVAWGDAGDDSIRVSVTALEPDRYELVLGAAAVEFCGGGTYCRAGTVTGALRPAGAPKPHGPRVPLPGGRVGVFTDATCGANCSDSKVTWDEGPYRYSVGLKAGRMDRVRRMAESVVQVP